MRTYLHFLLPLPQHIIPFSRLIEQNTLPISYLRHSIETFFWLYKSRSSNILFYFKQPSTHTCINFTLMSEISNRYMFRPYNWPSSGVEFTILRNTVTQCKQIYNRLKMESYTSVCRRPFEIK
jgi:hypothetical protein